jgi:hypothetical protein
MWCELADNSQTLLNAHKNIAYTTEYSLKYTMFATNKQYGSLM